MAQAVYVEEALNMDRTTVLRFKRHGEAAAKMSNSCCANVGIRVRQQVDSW